MITKRRRSKKLKLTIREMDPKKEEKKIVKLQEDKKKIMDFAQWRSKSMSVAYDSINQQYRDPGRDKSDEDSGDTTEDEDKFRTIESSLRDVKETQNLTLSILDQIQNMDINKDLVTPARQMVGTIRPPNLTNVANSSRNPFNPNLRINPPPQPSNQKTQKTQINQQ